MSASGLITIFCDGCGNWWDAGVAETAALARKGLRFTGWKLSVRVLGERQLQDYCPKCAKERK